MHRGYLRLRFFVWQNSTALPREGFMEAGIAVYGAEAADVQKVVAKLVSEFPHEVLAQQEYYEGRCYRARIRIECAIEEIGRFFVRYQGVVTADCSKCN
jgi:hypothetical protein